MFSVLISNAINIDKYHPTLTKALILSPGFLGHF